MESDPTKLFGSERESQATAPVPLTVAPEKRRLFSSPWSARIVSACALLLVLVACFEIYRRANHFGTRVVESHPVDARIEIVNPPAWLDRRIISTLLDQAYQFAQKDEANFNRFRNTLDASVLREIADLYTGTDRVDGIPQSRQANGYNAWIKSVKEVRRLVAADKSIQTIQIVAEWRQPAVWVRDGSRLYLIDAEGTRLPGDYRVEDRARSRLIALAGAELPGGVVARPGENWAGAGNSLGADMQAGMMLINALKYQQFAAQIEAVDVTNYAGRRDPRAPWMLLETAWRNAAGVPRVVYWGRPVGQEMFFEVQSASKLKTLNELNERFGRIDAGRDYVDIRTEVVRLPKIALAN